jgi:Ca2+-transporting ATPase
MIEVQGLSDREVEESRAKQGSNKLSKHKADTFWTKLAENASDPMIIILAVALVVVVVLSFFGYTEWYEGLGIAFAVILATFFDTWSEFKNEQTFQKLQEEASKIFLNVFRGRSVKRIGIEDIVVGDKVLLESGDKIPADGKITHGEIKVNQAILNGEPEPVSKVPGSPEHFDLNDNHSVFRGAVVEDGEAVMEVLQVGDETTFGQLAHELKKEERTGPLRLKLSNLANQIAKFAFFGAPLIAIAFMFKVIYLDNAGDFATYFSQWQLVVKDIVKALILAVIIIVVVVPEGLPMMIAIVLAQNMRRLLKSHVLVRQLLGIETSGSLNILFTDKTGTITLGKLEAVSFLTIDTDKEYHCANWISPEEMPYEIGNLLDLSLRENSASVINPEAKGEDDIILGGNSTERALLKFVYNSRNTYEPDQIRILNQVHFNSERKFSATRIKFEIVDEISLIKGAAEVLLAKGTHFYDSKGKRKELTEETMRLVSSYIEDKASEGYRIIGLATTETEVTESGLPDDLTILGFSFIRDELREDARPAIESLQKAGVQVVMITGDRHGTAVAIAKEAGIMTRYDDIAIGSKEMARFSDAELKEMLPRLKVVSRCLPSDKTRLVKLAQSIEMVVGMTGDGVNDSPALSKADVGFALGSGTEVAKEASDIVLLDDNIHSVANAVHYGRTIYRSVQKFITFQLTVNVSAILIAFLGPFLGFELPLTMIQLLWINLVMDTLAALAFSGEPPLPKHMEEQPKSRDETLISQQMWTSIFSNGIFITLVSIIFLETSFIHGFFERPELMGTDRWELPFLTGFFTLFVFLNNFNKFNVRVEETTLLHHIGKNKGFIRVVILIFLIQIVLVYFGGLMFRTIPLTWTEWAIVLLISFLIIPFDIARKRLLKSGI